MENLKQNLGHIITVTLIIGAAVALAITNKISGAEAIGIIGTAGGFSMGGGVASSSAGTSTPVVASVVASPLASTSGPTPTAETPATEHQA